MSGFTNYTNLAESIGSEAERRKLLGETILPFDVPFLDDSLGGICRDDLILLGGRSGGGKSEFAVHIALAAASTGKKVFYFGLEFSTQELERRVLFKRLASRFYEDQNRPAGTPEFQAWMLNRQERLFVKYYTEEKEKLSGLSNFLIRNRASAFTVEDLERNIISEKNCDLFIIDHLHYFDLDTGQNENEGMKKIMKAIRQHVLDFDRPVILVSHIRKGDPKGEQLAPGQDDFHGSSDIFKIATKAITIAPAETTAGPGMWGTHVRVVKNRFAGDRCRFLATMAYDARRNAYTSKYKLNLINNAGNTAKEIDPYQRPHWAERASW